MRLRRWKSRSSSMSFSPCLFLLTSSSTLGGIEVSTTFLSVVIAHLHQRT